MPVPDLTDAQVSQIANASKILERGVKAAARIIAGPLDSKGVYAIAGTIITATLAEHISALEPTDEIVDILLADITNRTREFVRIDRAERDG